MKKAGHSSSSKSSSGIIKKAFIISVLVLVGVILAEKLTQPETPSKPLENINLPNESAVNLDSQRNTP